MDKIAIKEETKGKRSIRWRWPLAALVVVFLAVAATFMIGFIFDNSSSFSYPHQESGKYKELQKHDKLKIPLRQYRERPPTSYIVKFESYTKLVELVKDGYYESRPFTVDGFNWTFIIYPNGNKKDLVTNWVSVYARIDNSSLINDPQDVYAEIKFFAYNVINKYYTYQETEAQRFHLSNTDWGVPLFLDANNFKFPVFGFIFNGDQCVFGVDIFVAQPYKKWEFFSYDEDISNPVFNWNLTNFSTLSNDSYTSDLFTSGGRNWLLKVYPNGNGVGMGNSLSLYLLNESNENDYVQAKLRILNQVPSNHVEKSVEGWPNAAENGWGFEEFIPLADLKDATKGFVVDDLLQVEVEIIAFSKTDSF